MLMVRGKACHTYLRILYDSLCSLLTQVLKDLVAHGESSGLELVIDCYANAQQIFWENSLCNSRGEKLFHCITSVGLMTTRMECTQCSSGQREVNI